MGKAISRDQIIQVVALLQEGKRTQWEISRIVGISQATVSKIKNGQVLIPDEGDGHFHTDAWQATADRYKKETPDVFRGIQNWASDNNIPLSNEGEMVRRWNIFSQEVRWRNDHKEMNEAMEKAVREYGNPKQLKELAERNAQDAIREAEKQRVYQEELPPWGLLDENNIPWTEVLEKDPNHPEIKRYMETRDPILRHAIRCGINDFRHNPKKWREEYILKAIKDVEGWFRGSRSWTAYATQLSPYSTAEEQDAADKVALTQASPASDLPDPAISEFSDGEK